MDMNDAYAVAVHIDGAEEYPARWAKASASFRDKERSRLDLSYGPDERQKMDLFLPQQEPTGLAMFIHGGYWRAFGRKDWSHLAAGALARGWAMAVPSYRLAPNVRISEITRDIVAALELAAAEIAGPIAVTGHSAGGHLSARMMCADVGLDHNVQGRITQISPISPLADLRPLLDLDLNSDWRLDPAEAIAESAALHAPIAGVGVEVWVGGDEQSVFLDQARWLSDAWGAGLHIESGKHHFDVIDAMADPKSAMITSLLRENRVTGA